MYTMKEAVKWCAAAAALAVALSSVPVFAFHKVVDPVGTPATDKVVNVPTVPRGMPDRTPYAAFDPPRSSLFDISKFTVTGDIRVRPEMRNAGCFGLSSTGAGCAFAGNAGAAQSVGGNGYQRGKSNLFFVQQWFRMGLNYNVSPDVDVFFQAQYSKNWGADTLAGSGNIGANNTCGAGICANDPFNVGLGNSLFVRQAYVIVRNVGIENLSFKLGRQLIAFGNHRLFGTFDWANTGFSHDGITMNYSSKFFDLVGGWLRPADFDFSTFGANSSSFGVGVPGVGTGFAGGTNASNDVDIYFARPVFKPFKGLLIEPMWVWLTSGAKTPSVGSPVVLAHAPNQQRHTIGGRIAYRHKIIDGTVEGYYQVGSMGINPGSSTRSLGIHAYALAAQAGVTMPVPMQPRLGFEFNYASGDGNANNCTSANPAGCNGTANTFENLFPTNHILMGYMDLFAWRNMVAYSPNFQMRPTKDSHLEIAGWFFYKATAGDNWYRAAQNVYFNNLNANGQATRSSSLGRELDVVFTKFFKDNKVGWQVGYSHFFAGSFLDQATCTSAQLSSGCTAVDQNWAYTQIHVNF